MGDRGTPMAQYSAPPSALLPRTTAVSAVAVFKGASCDGMFPVKVQVPWEHLADVRLVTLAFHVPRGFDPEIMLIEPAYVLCQATAVEDDALDPESAPLATMVEVIVETDGVPFHCGVKFEGRNGMSAAVTGETSEELKVEAFSRRYPR